MPLPVAGAVILGTIATVSGRLVKKQIETHNKMEKIKKDMQRNTGGVTTESKTVGKLYRPSK
jgi:hypothetical protein